MPTTIPQTLEKLTYDQLCELSAKVETQKQARHQETEKERVKMRGMLDGMLTTLQGSAVIVSEAKQAVAAPTPTPVAPATNGKHTKPAKRRSPMKGKKAPIQYRHGKQTWSGRGKTPGWLASLEKSGRNRTEFLVA